MATKNQSVLEKVAKLQEQGLSKAQAFKRLHITPATFYYYRNKQKGGTVAAKPAPQNNGKRLTLLIGTPQEVAEFYSSLESVTQ
jgi:hypothetical protein